MRKKLNLGYQSYITKGNKAKNKKIKYLNKT